MAVKISRVLTRTEAKHLAALLGEERDLVDYATTSNSGIWTGKHCSVFYLARENRYRVVYLSQHLRKE